MIVGSLSPRTAERPAACQIRPRAETPRSCLKHAYSEFAQAATPEQALKARQSVLIARDRTERSQASTCSAPAVPRVSMLDPTAATDGPITASMVQELGLRIERCHGSLIQTRTADAVAFHPARAAAEFQLRGRTYPRACQTAITVHPFQGHASRHGRQSTKSLAGTVQHINLTRPHNRNCLESFILMLAKGSAESQWCFHSNHRVGK